MSGDYEKLFQQLESLSGDYDATQIFNDWVQMCAIAIQNGCDVEHDDVWQFREKQYCDLASKHKGLLEPFTKMFALLASCLEDEPYDYLGKLYMDHNAGNVKTGQFFTPYHISQLTASFGELDESERLAEPSCGSGSMVIAKYQQMMEHDQDFRPEKMHVTCKDLSWNSVYMCYVQLSLLGIDAVCIQGDALGKEAPDKHHVLTSPASMGLIAYG